MARLSGECLQSNAQTCGFTMSQSNGCQSTPQNGWRKKAAVLEPCDGCDELTTKKAFLNLGYYGVLVLEVHCSHLFTQNAKPDDSARLQCRIFLS